MGRLLFGIVYSVVLLSNFILSDYLQFVVWFALILGLVITSFQPAKSIRKCKPIEEAYERDIRCIR